MPNGFGPPPDLDVRDPGSLGRYLGYLGAVVYATHNTVHELEGWRAGLIAQAQQDAGAARERGRWKGLAEDFCKWLGLGVVVAAAIVGSVGALVQFIA